MSAKVFRNSILNALDPAAIERLRLQPVVFELRHEMEFPGSPVGAIWFVEAGMASLTTTFEDGSQVEAGMFGHESVIGISALMGTHTSLNRIYTQIAGHGFMCTVADGRREFQLGKEFQALALRYVQAQLVQAMQSSGCNAKHSIERRLAKWMLLCADRAGSDTYRMSHEFLADMLGSTRPTVSLAAGMLKEQGLIRYSRGTIRIQDTAGLESRACECYAVMKAYLNGYTDAHGAADVRVS